MGCDIHLQVERRSDGEWERVPHADLPCDWCDGARADCWRCKGAGHCVRAFYDGRNYDVFAILANVRNGVGFAGCDTGDGFVPIDDPRGWPDDLSDEIRAVAEHEDDGLEWDDPQSYYMGDHSFTYVTVPELLAYDWDRTTKKRGWVGADAFEEFEREGRPSSWSSMVAGGSTMHVSNQEMRRRLEDGSARINTLTSYYTLVEWEVPYRDSASYFLEALHRDILPLGAPDDLRLVFGFDS